MLADIHPRAQIGADVEIGAFCTIGPHVILGDGCRLDSHVSITGYTTIGHRNRFWPGSVIGGEPQDSGYKDSPERLEIGDDNLFREGVTVNRGAAKEDGVTRIGSRNFLMANAHVAHNCHVFNNTILCNGVLLGGHVHVQDFAIVSGNSVVHHFATVGESAFVSGGCRVPQDVPPFMLSAGSDNPEVITINLVGMRRRGMSEDTIAAVRQIYKWLYREHRAADDIRQQLQLQYAAAWPPEVARLMAFLENTSRGKNGRAREAVRCTPPAANDAEVRRAA